MNRTYAGAREAWEAAGPATGYAGGAFEAPDPVGRGEGSRHLLDRPAGALISLIVVIPPLSEVTVTHGSDAGSTRTTA
jgi:hypothetical protein